ncbi:MAG TPA: phosphoglycerate mutase, partial [Rhodanobacteraceae bacterium]|nr:phosphoglycerate mutase [Rhodanobacteraceae bacterium]
AGVPIEAGAPSRWYVRCAGDFGLPEFAAPEVVLGDDLRAHLPAGDAGRRWRVLLNEAQVLLHHHPLNVQRKARGQPVVNSVWFWGAGRRPDRVRSDAREAVSDDALVQALARRAGIRCSTCGSGFDEMNASAQTGPRLLDLRRVFGETLEQAWLGPIDAALRKRRIGAVDLLFRSGERCRVRGSDRWRFWRPVRPLDA